MSKRGAGLPASLPGPSRPGVPMPGKVLAVPSLRAGTRATFPSPLPGSLPFSSTPHGQRKHFPGLFLYTEEPKASLNGQADNRHRDWGTMAEIQEAAQTTRWAIELSYLEGELPSVEEVMPRRAQELCGLHEGCWLTLCPWCFSPKPDTLLFSGCSELRTARL